MNEYARAAARVHAGLQALQAVPDALRATYSDEFTRELYNARTIRKKYRLKRMRYIVELTKMIAERCKPPGAYGLLPAAFAREVGKVTLEPDVGYEGELGEHQWWQELHTHQWYIELDAMNAASESEAEDDEVNTPFSSSPTEKPHIVDPDAGSCRLRPVDLTEPEQEERKEEPAPNLYPLRLVSPDRDEVDELIVTEAPEEKKDAPLLPPVHLSTPPLAVTNVDEDDDDLLLIFPEDDSAAPSCAASRPRTPQLPTPPPSSAASFGNTTSPSPQPTHKEAESKSAPSPVPSHTPVSIPASPIVVPSRDPSPAPSDMALETPPSSPPAAPPVTLPAPSSRKRSASVAELDNNANEKQKTMKLEAMESVLGPLPQSPAKPSSTDDGRRVSLTASVPSSAPAPVSATTTPTLPAATTPTVPVATTPVVPAAQTPTTPSKASSLPEKPAPTPPVPVYYASPSSSSAVAGPSRLPANIPARPQPQQQVPVYRSPANLPVRPGFVPGGSNPLQKLSYPPLPTPARTSSGNVVPVQNASNGAAPVPVYPAPSSSQSTASASPTLPTDPSSPEDTRAESPEAAKLGKRARKTMRKRQAAEEAAQVQQQHQQQEVASARQAMLDLSAAIAGARANKGYTSNLSLGGGGSVAAGTGGMRYVGAGTTGSVGGAGLSAPDPAAVIQAVLAAANAVSVPNTAMGTGAPKFAMASTSTVGNTNAPKFVPAATSVGSATSTAASGPSTSTALGSATSTAGKATGSAKVPNFVPASTSVGAATSAIGDVFDYRKVLPVKRTPPTGVVPMKKALPTGPKAAAKPVPTAPRATTAAIASAQKPVPTGPKASMLSVSSPIPTGPRAGIATPASTPSTPIPTAPRAAASTPVPTGPRAAATTTSASTSVPSTPKKATATPPAASPANATPPAQRRVILKLPANPNAAQTEAAPVSAKPTVSTSAPPAQRKVILKLPPAPTTASVAPSLAAVPKPASLPPIPLAVPVNKPASLPPTPIYTAPAPNPGDFDPDEPMRDASPVPTSAPTKRKMSYTRAEGVTFMGRQGDFYRPDESTPSSSARQGDSYRPAASSSTSTSASAQGWRGDSYRPETTAYPPQGDSYRPARDSWGEVDDDRMYAYRPASPAIAASSSVPIYNASTALPPLPVAKPAKPLEKPVCMSDVRHPSCSTPLTPRALIAHMSRAHGWDALRLPGAADYICGGGGPGGMGIDRDEFEKRVWDVVDGRVDLSEEGRRMRERGDSWRPVDAPPTPAYMHSGDSYRPDDDVPMAVDDTPPVCMAEARNQLAGCARLPAGAGVVWAHMLRAHGWSALGQPGAREFICNNAPRRTEFEKRVWDVVDGKVDLGAAEVKVKIERLEGTSFGGGEDEPPVCMADPSERRDTCSSPMTPREVWAHMLSAHRWDALRPAGVAQYVCGSGAGLRVSRATFETRVREVMNGYIVRPAQPMNNTGSMNGNGKQRRGRRGGVGRRGLMAESMGGGGGYDY